MKGHIFHLTTTLSQRYTKNGLKNLDQFPIYCFYFLIRLIILISKVCLNIFNKFILKTNTIVAIRSTNSLFSIVHKINMIVAVRLTNLLFSIAYNLTATRLTMFTLKTNWCTYLKTQFFFIYNENEFKKGKVTTSKYRVGLFEDLQI